MSTVVLPYLTPVVDGVSTSAFHDVLLIISSSYGLVPSTSDSRTIFFYSFIHFSFFFFSFLLL